MIFQLNALNYADRLYLLDCTYYHFESYKGNNKVLTKEKEMLTRKKKISREEGKKKSRTD